MRQLILFDIDCTLIYCAGAGLRCMGRATRELLGFDFEGSAIRPDGWTDPLILRELLRQNDVCQSRWADLEVQVWERYAHHLEAELNAEGAGRRLEPGVVPLLERLHGDGRFALGLLTGNLERTARLKLAPFNLNRFFPLGAFACDSPVRDELGPVALERARRHFGVDFAPADCWVVGDTPRDIQCGRALGGRVLAVATGHYTVEQLSEHGPDAVLSDLTETDKVVNLLGNPTPAVTVFPDTDS